MQVTIQIEQNLVKHFSLKQKFLLFLFINNNNNNNNSNKKTISPEVEENPTESKKCQAPHWSVFHQNTQI